MSETIIHPNALVEPGAKLGAGVQIGPFSIIRAGAELHDGVHIHGQVHIGAGVCLGRECEVFPQAVLGGAPQDLKYKGEETRLVIGKRNIIREHVTMHTGTEAGHGVTRIGDNGYFMVGAHIAHDCVVGNHVVFANAVAIGGFVQVGDYANLGGMVGVHQFTRIGHHAFVGALAYVSRDVIPYGMAVDNPARLNGLNVIGMQRAGIARKDIHTARAAYKALFDDETRPFSERLSILESRYKDSVLVMDMVEFIKVSSDRALCLPDAD